MNEIVMRSIAILNIKLQQPQYAAYVGDTVLQQMLLDDIIRSQIFAEVHR